MRNDVNSRDEENNKISPNMNANLNPENFKQSSRKILKDISVNNAEERAKFSGNILSKI